MEWFIVFGLVYLFGCMVTAVICSIGYDARKDTRNEGEKDLVIDVMCWPIIVSISCVKRITTRIKQV